MSPRHRYTRGAMPVSEDLPVGILLHWTEQVAGGPIFEGRSSFITVMSKISKEEERRWDDLGATSTVCLEARVLSWVSSSLLVKLTKDLAQGSK